MAGVFQFEGKVIKPDRMSLDEIDSVMIRIAAHEDEKISNPIGYAEAQDGAIEFCGLVNVRHGEGDVAQL